MNQTMNVSNTQSKVFYKAAGVLAILVVLAGLTNAITSMGTVAQDNSTVNIIEWFTLFQTHRFAAFSRLGVINILTLSLSIPIYLAFTQAFQKDRLALVAFASILFFTGTTVYLSSNTVFALFAVSQQYANATSLQKPLLEATGQALFTQGANLTSGTFVGLFLTQIAGLLITSAMLRGEVFGKWSGIVGLVGFSLMSVFFILTAFVPAQYDNAMLIAIPGALFMIAYQILIARKFFQLGK